jgi:DNA-binding transcriptional MerR regulator
MATYILVAMDTDRLTLEELAQRAGIPARQIRELIRLGVIPAPSSRGRGATYGPEHAERLQAWKRLKADAPTGTTNEQLRALIQRLADQGLLRGIADGSVPFALVDDGKDEVAIARQHAAWTDANMSDPGITMDRVNEDALSYLANMSRAEPARLLLRHDQPQPTLEVDIRAAQRAGPALALRRLRAALAQYVAAAASPVRINASKSEIWHRVNAGRDIEIAARGPLTPDEIHLLETIGQLLQQAIYRKER